MGTAEERSWEKCRGEPLDGLGDVELVGSVVDLVALEARVAAERMRRVAQIEARRVWEVDGGRSGPVWLARRTHRDDAEERRESGLISALVKMPLADVAFEAGEISLAHVRALSRGVSTKERAEAFGEIEAHLVEVAKNVQPRDLRRLVDIWVDQVDPDGSDGDSSS
jgi:hypothetical protein